MSTKTELQQRIEKCEAELASLKADMAKCDCADGIEQEKCWQVLTVDDGVYTAKGRRKADATVYLSDRPHCRRIAYMPECRQVTAEDARDIWDDWKDGTTLSHEEFAKRAHKLGFRIKVSP